MQDRHCEDALTVSNNGDGTRGEYEDKPIQCMDCADEFIWTAGEQQFFHDKNLLNPPKRCRKCKRAKTQRLEAIESSKATGKRIHFEVAAQCAMCSTVTTVPFYPSQQRPVYCRDCYAKVNIAGQPVSNISAVKR
jgi:CxxC-x17-CxxC domain-containing protein